MYLSIQNLGNWEPGNGKAAQLFEANRVWAPMSLPPNNPGGVPLAASESLDTSLRRPSGNDVTAVMNES